MVRVISIAVCYICLLLLELTSSLKCRTGTQQVDEQFRKIIQICKKRYANNNNHNDDSSSSEDNASENFSNVDMLHKFFMSSNSDNKFSVAQSWKEQNDNWNRRNDQKKNEHGHSLNYTNGDWRGMQYLNRGNNRDLEYSDRTTNSDYDQLYDSNSGNYDKEQRQACIVQCFFNELNMVDRRGFPEQESVIQLMTHNIQNPELQDFIEEAIIECFYYFNSDMKRDKCYFSQNLLACLSDKGKERCEDWDN